MHYSFFLHWMLLSFHLMLHLFTHKFINCLLFPDIFYRCMETQILMCLIFWFRNANVCRLTDNNGFLKLGNFSNISTAAKVNMFADNSDPISYTYEDRYNISLITSATFVRYRKSDMVLTIWFHPTSDVY